MAKTSVGSGGSGGGNDLTNFKKVPAPAPKPAPKPPAPKPAPKKSPGGSPGQAGSGSPAGPAPKKAPASAPAPTSGVGSFFGIPGLTDTEIQTLLGTGGFGQQLQYLIGKMDANIASLRQQEDAHHNAALEAIAKGQLALAQKEEADANSVQVVRNQIEAKKNDMQVQSDYSANLMKMSESPENAYRYAFARYGYQPPQGADAMKLPLPAPVQSLLNTANLAPGAMAPPQAAVTQAAPLLPGVTPGASSGSMAGQPVPRPQPAGPPGLNALLPRPPEHAAPLEPEPTPKPPVPPTGAQPPEGGPQFAQGGVAGAGSSTHLDGLMRHALDMAKVGGTLLKQHATAPPAPSPGGLRALMPQSQPGPMPTGPPGSSPANPLPAFATGGIAGGYPANPSEDIRRLQLLGLPQAPTPTAPPTTQSGFPAGPTSPPSPPAAGLPNATQNLGPYQGPYLTLEPYLQQLYAQTGRPQSGIPLTPPSGWKIPSIGTPSQQSLRGLAPSESSNLQGFKRDIEGVPIDDFKNDLEKHNEIGTGLEVPHDFGTTATQGFAAGGVAGLGAAPSPAPGIQVAPGPGTFGEAGPEAAVPLASPGGPMAMAALQQNAQTGMPGGMPPGPPPPPGGGLSSLLQPTSRDVGPMATSPLIPLVDVPTSKMGPGDRGHQVGRLQQALERAGYLVMPPGANYGFYGPVTTQAVAQLQQSHPDPGSYKPGYWDAKSAKWLKSQLQGSHGPQGPDPGSMRSSDIPGQAGGPMAPGTPQAHGDAGQPGGLGALLSL